MWYIHDPILKKAFPILDKQNQKMVIVEFIPTVENICQLIFNNMKKELKDSGLVVEKAKLFETPNSWAEAINNS
jgi:6-pyruvoyl-tetrahydropterin synthase